MNETSQDHRPKVGDMVEVTEHRVGDSARRGEILEVIGQPENVHFRVRWESGDESIFYPSSDATIRRQRLEAPDNS